VAPFEDPGGRSAAEREAARQQRERRRAERRGEPVAEPGTVSQTSPPAPTGEEPMRAASAAVETVEPPGSPSGQEPLQEQIDPDATQAFDVAAGEEVPKAHDAGGKEVPEPRDLDGKQVPEAQEAGGQDTSSEPRRPQTRARWRPHSAADHLPAAPAPALAAAGRRSRAPRHRASRGEAGHSLRARAGAVGALVLVAVLVWLVVMLIQHLGGTSKPALQATPPPSVTVVIPEGESRLQIAAIARKDGLRGNYLRASTHSSGLQVTRFGGPASTPNLEGFLFPATYKLPVHGTVKRLVEAQLEAFQERFGPEEKRHARALHLSAYQMLIVASMIEREAYLPRDRPLVAAVIYNRLRIGMPLGIDSTIRFALNDYSKPLTEAQLKMASPYNTRLNRGLPPTPISNPGTEAIEAAARPAHVGYLFYVDGADGCGDLVFSDTEAEFEAHKLAYNEALARNGGHTPTCKHR
jgi:cell division protein YceG involved in septum cleavage